MKIEKCQLQIARTGGAARLSEKHVADLADQKKSLEITGYSCNDQVRHVADLRRGWRSAGSVRERKMSGNTATGKSEVQKDVAVLAILAALQKSPGNFDVFKTAQDRQVAALERLTRALPFRHKSL
jgi:hypothetical protein